MKQYQPGSHKLMHHTEHLQNIKEGYPCGPIHLSLFPNSKCNFNCSYCLGKNITNRTGELGLEEYKKLLHVLINNGLKAVEFSGLIGESTFWKHFNEAIEYTWKTGLCMSLITNGTNLKDIPDDTLKIIDWIRVSIQSPQHFDSIDFDRLKKLTRISTSYMLAEGDLDTNKKLYNVYKKIENKGIVMRVAVARPCSSPFEIHIKNAVHALGEPMFFSEKPSGKPLGCYAPYYRAAVDWNGNFLPCPSRQLTYDSEGKIPEGFALCHIKDLEVWLKNNPPHDLGYRCDFCGCGKQNNDLIYSLLHPVDDIDFV